MKKLLSFALALLIVGATLSLAACKNDSNEPEDPNTEDPSVNTPVDPDPVEPVDPADAVVFTAVDEYVKADVTVQIRVKPSLDVDNVIGNLRINEIVKRVGVSTDGAWSKVLMTPAGFEEGEYYVSSNCVSLYEGELPTDPEDPTVDPEQPGTTEPTDPTEPETPAEPEQPADPNGMETVTPFDAYSWAEPSLKLRAEPSVMSSELTRIPFGEKLQVVAKNDRWSKVFYGTTTGYVLSEYLTLRDVTASDFVAFDTAKAMTVNTNALFVRYYPFSEDIDGNIISTSDAVFGSLIDGDVVTATATSADGKWTRIQWEDGNSYYVYSKYLSGGGTTPTTPTQPVTPTTPTVTFTSLASPVLMYPTSVNVLVYSTPDTLTTPVKTLAIVDTVTCTHMSTDAVWYKVKLANDTTEYYVQAAKLKSFGK